MVYIYIYILEPYIIQERTKIIVTLSLNLLNAVLIICTVVTAIGILGRVVTHFASIYACNFAIATN